MLLDVLIVELSKKISIPKTAFNTFDMEVRTEHEDNEDLVESIIRKYNEFTDKYGKFSLSIKQNEKKQNFYQVTWRFRF